jgi:hypothetical protein
LSLIDRQYEMALMRTDRGLFLDKGNLVCDVRHSDYEGGAKGDNINDDTAALQACLDECVEKRGAMFIPEGVFKHTGLTGTDRVPIIAMGPDSILRNVNSQGGPGLVLAHDSTTIDSAPISNVTMSGEADSGDVLVLKCYHRSVLSGITIPSAGAGGLVLDGSLLNTLIGCKVTTNHPYTVGTRRAPTHGFIARQGTAGTCEGNGANANTFLGCSAEGITNGDGLGYLLESDSNKIIGGASEGNKEAVRLGAGVHGNVIWTYMEANSVGDVVPTDATLGDNYIFPDVGGIAMFNLFRVGDGAQASPGFAFRDDPTLGMFRLGDGEIVFVYEDGRTFGLRSDGIEFYKPAHPDTTGTHDLGLSGKAWKDLFLTGVVTIDGAQVVGPRITGWGAAAGTATRTSFDTATVTTELLAQRVKALLDDLQTHGLIGN